MARMIKLTRKHNGMPIWINADRIQTLYADAKSGLADIWLAGSDDGPVEVQESAEQVVALIEAAHGTIVSPTEPTT